MTRKNSLRYLKTSRVVGGAERIIGVDKRGNVVLTKRVRKKRSSKKSGLLDYDLMGGVN